MENRERIDHPDYYQIGGGIETIDIVRDMDFCLGNCVKYLLRAGRKQEAGMTALEKQIEDLRKAQWYLADRIKTLEAQWQQELDQQYKTN